MNSDEVKKYIRERSELFWYIKEAEKENISLEFLVKTILNFGSLDDVKKLFDLIGIEKTAVFSISKFHGKGVTIFQR
jgi:hypothetical protein